MGDDQFLPVLMIVTKGRAPGRPTTSMLHVGGPSAFLSPHPPPPGARFPFFYVFPKQNSFTLTLLNRGLNLESGSKGHAVTVWSRVDLDNQVLDK